MTDLVHDFFVTLAPSDAAGLAAARDHHRHLERFPQWQQPSDSVFLMQMGENLFRLAFPSDEAAADLVDRLAAAIRAEAVLRVWLQTADPHVAMLPWEYLCLTEAAVEDCRRQGIDIRKYQPHTTMPDERTFLALHPNVSLVRQTSPQPPEQELERIGALKVLVTWANPGPPPWPLINGLEMESASIAGHLQSLEAGLVEVRELRHASRRKLQNVLDEWKPHVLHFAGHGAFPGGPDDPGDLPGPALVLEAEGKSSATPHDYLSAEALRRLCAESRVQVVVLNNCWGGRTSPDFTGIAHALTRSSHQSHKPDAQAREKPGLPSLARRACVGAVLSTPPAGEKCGLAAPTNDRPVPVVIAHQIPVPQSAAVGFAAKFYQNAALARPLDEGVRAFRAEMAAQHAFGCGAPDWGVPVVFLGVRQSALFRTERIDPYPINFGPVIQEHVPIVGREFLKLKFAEFKAKHASGIFVLTAPPGTGKTAFVAQWVSDEQNTAHFFFRATAGVTDPDECVKSLYRSLLAKYGIQEDTPTSDAVELRGRLRKLLDRISERCARLGRDEVVLIDALDEAGTTASDRKPAVEVLATALPPRVYLFVTSRPGPMADRLAAAGREPPFHLDPTSSDNQRDAAAFCRRELAGRISDAEPESLERVAAQLAQQAKGNFLVLKLFLSKESLGERLTTSELERAGRDLTGAVETEYERFFDRLCQRIKQEAEKPDTQLDLVYGVLGAFVTAPAPITRDQVCAAFGLRVRQWDDAFARICQFLERGGIRQEERGELTYRLYHETFREFLLHKLAPELPDHHRRWAEHCLRWRERKGYDRLYALRYLPTHLIEASKR